MRSSEEIKRLIIDVATNDERIRAVLLNGSRANDKIPPDKYQDFDVVYIVDDFESFIADKSWTNVFGDKLIWQLPDEMVVGKKDTESARRSSLLMLFTDGNRIDLTLQAIDEVKGRYKPDSLTVTWLDKDNLFSNMGLPKDSDYVINKPTEKEFLDTCNEFWWVSTYVAKGLARNEIIYSKQMLETAVRPMFMNVIAWYIGIKTNFTVSIGQGGKFINKFLSPDLYEQVLQTYSDYEPENNWRALFTMTNIFGRLARAISAELTFKYLVTEEDNVIAYLNQIYNERKTGSR